MSNSFANMIASGLMAMNAVNTIAVGPTLLPMNRLIDCPECEGHGERLFNAMTSNDPNGQLRECRHCEGRGLVPNPDFDKDALVCPCGNPLHVGDDCRVCGGAR